MPLLDHTQAARLITGWKDHIESQALVAIVPPERVKALVRRCSEEEVATKEVLPRAEKLFDALLERGRKIDRSAAQLLGPKITARLIEAAGEAEPDDAAIHAFFEERAVGDLLGAVLYDGIIEFMRKANSITDQVPGMQAAKRLAGGVGGILGGLAGGLAGSIAGGVREELEKKLEAQVRGFLQGFGKVAVERAARFATSPQNKKVFEEMRQNLARKALDRPLREALGRLTPERQAELRARVREAVLERLRDERTSHKLEAEVDRLAAAHGQESVAALAKRLFGGVIPTDIVVKHLAPGLVDVTSADAVIGVLREAVKRAGWFNAAPRP